jgi:hypothetical protein
MKSCTYCGKEHPDEATVCSIDGQPLRSTVLTPTPPAPASRQTESVLGIVSFGISLAAGFLMLATFVAAGILNAGRHQYGQRYPGQEVVGIAIILLLAADLAAAGLGIAALCQPGKKKLFGILGLVFSSGTVIGAMGIMIIGLIYASRFRH